MCAIKPKLAFIKLQDSELLRLQAYKMLEIVKYSTMIIKIIENPFFNILL